MKTIFANAVKFIITSLVVLVCLGNLRAVNVGLYPFVNTKPIPLFLIIIASMFFGVVLYILYFYLAQQHKSVNIEDLLHKKS